MDKRSEAIAKWLSENRPELMKFLPDVEKNDVALMLLTVGFEAGRQFQKENPEFPLNSPHLYLS